MRRPLTIYGGSSSTAIPRHLRHRTPWLYISVWPWAAIWTACFSRAGVTSTGLALPRAIRRRAVGILPPRRPAICMRTMMRCGLGKGTLDSGPLYLSYDWQRRRAVVTRTVIVASETRRLAGALFVEQGTLFPAERRALRFRCAHRLAESTSLPAASFRSRWMPGVWRNGKRIAAPKNPRLGSVRMSDQGMKTGGCARRQSGSI